MVASVVGGVVASVVGGVVASVVGGVVASVVEGVVASVVGGVVASVVGGVVASVVGGAVDSVVGTVADSVVGLVASVVITGVDSAGRSASLCGSVVGNVTNINTISTKITIALIFPLINLRRIFCHFSIGAIKAETTSAMIQAKLGIVTSARRAKKPTMIQRAMVFINFIDVHFLSRFSLF